MIYYVLKSFKKQHNEYIKRRKDIFNLINNNFTCDNIEDNVVEFTYNGKFNQGFNGIVVQLREIFNKVEYSEGFGRPSIYIHTECFNKYLNSNEFRMLIQPEKEKISDKIISENITRHITESVSNISKYCKENNIDIDEYFTIKFLNHEKRSVPRWQYEHSIENDLYYCTQMCKQYILLEDDSTALLQLILKNCKDNFIKKCFIYYIVSESVNSEYKNIENRIKRENENIKKTDDVKKIFTEYNACYDNLENDNLIFNCKGDSKEFIDELKQIGITAKEEGIFIKKIVIDKKDFDFDKNGFLLQDLFKMNEKLYQEIQTRQMNTSKVIPEQQHSR